jgi:hypothetical protein
MGLKLWKITQSQSFGSYRLIDFLERHGASDEEKTALAVPASGFRAALDHPDEAGLTEEDIRFIQKELAAFGGECSDPGEVAGDDNADDEDEEPVDLYDLG